MHADPLSGMGDGGDGAMGGTTVARSWALQHKPASRTDSKTVSKNGNREGTTDRVVRDVTQGLILEELPRQRNWCHVLGLRMGRGFQSRDSRVVL